MLTWPRLHFLAKVARCFDAHSYGIQLSGVHGAGKSTTLRALVGILTLGGQCDVMFAPQAGALADLDLATVLSTALHGSSQLAVQLHDGQLGASPFAFRHAWQKLWQKLWQKMAHL